MTDPALTRMIREVLAEEVTRLKGEVGNKTAVEAKRETVRIAGSDDLNAFARHMVELAGNPARLREFQTGKLVFELAGAPAHDSKQSTPVPASTDIAHRIDTGFVSERQIDKLPKGLKRLVLAKKVRITPLARDRARQRGITIERIEQ